MVVNVVHTAFTPKVLNIKAQTSELVFQGGRAFFFIKLSRVDVRMEIP